MFAAVGILPDVVVRLVIVTEPGISGTATALQLASTKLETLYVAVWPGFKVFTEILQGPLPVPVAVWPLLKVNVHAPTAVTTPLTTGLTLLHIGFVAAT